ncbi:MAG: response regulator [Robiginitomaculum sp.]|nr:response regulator [Robiginitomaculum sp.]
MKYNILVADDDASIRFVLSKYLTRAGYGVKATDNPQTLLKWAKAGEGDVILTDVHMGADEIFSFIPELKTVRPDLPIIIISANTRMVTALKSRQSGVFEYIPKPFDLPELEGTVKRALDTQAIPERQISKKPDQMIGRSKVMQPVFRAISDYASGLVPVFIWGDAGTGKNLAAQCVHDAGERSTQSFVLFSSLDNNKDLFEAVGAGDLLVDRVHELDAKQQAQLLEALEHNESRGDNDKFRVIVTAEESLEQIQQNQVLRSDLSSHLMGGRIYLPPLRERSGDIVDLASHFINSVRPGARGNIDKPAQARLKAHTWPGNVRELRNLMHVIALQFSDRDITDNIVERILAPQKTIESRDNTFEDIKLACTELLGAAHAGADNSENSPFEQALEWVEKPLIAEALRLTGGNNSKAADLLGIHRNTLRTKLRKWQDK